MSTQVPPLKDALIDVLESIETLSKRIHLVAIAHNVSPDDLAREVGASLNRKIKRFPRVKSRT